MAAKPPEFTADFTESTLESRQVLDGGLLKVWRDEVRLPDGGRAEWPWWADPELRPRCSVRSSHSRDRYPRHDLPRRQQPGPIADPERLASAAASEPDLSVVFPWARALRRTDPTRTVALYGSNTRR